MKKINEKNVLGELAAIAFADVSDYVTVETVEGRGQVLTVVDTALISKAKRRAICSMKAGTKGIELKLYDKLKALELLGRVCGVFGTKQENDEKELLSELRGILETGDDCDADG